MNSSQTEKNVSVFTGVVQSIRPYGVFVDVDSDILLVHMTDQSWFWPYDPRRHYSVGKEVLTWVGVVNRNGQPIRIGSFRLVHPEHNPAGRLRVGDCLKGVVAAVDRLGLSISLGPNQAVDFAKELLAKGGIDSGCYRPGDPLDVVVDCILNDGAFVLRPSSGPAK